MGDTQGTIVIWSCTEETAGALRVYLEDWLGFEAEEAAPHEQWLLIGGAGYTPAPDRGVSAGFISDGTVAQALIETAPDACWVAWEDPYEEWLGTVAVHVPGFGLHTAACDASGEPYYSRADLRSGGHGDGHDWWDFIDGLRRCNPDGAWIDAPTPNEDAEEVVPGLSPAARALMSELLTKAAYRGGLGDAPIDGAAWDELRAAFPEADAVRSSR